MDKVIIYTDGACRGNPGPGGWGAIIKYTTHNKEIYGYETLTTNNRMEMMAAIKALQEIPNAMHCIIYTDSKYVYHGITDWIHNWKKRHWKNIKNVDLWQLLDDINTAHSVQWHWVKGHNGNIDNERADWLANYAIETAQQLHSVK
jgi:ribonuclease HI